MSDDNDYYSSDSTSFLDQGIDAVSSNPEPDKDDIPITVVAEVLKIYQQMQ